MPVERAPAAPARPASRLVVVEQAQLHALGVLGEDREVRSLAVPRRTERERPARPLLAHATTAPDSGESVTWPSPSSADAVASATVEPAHGTCRGSEAKLHTRSSPPRRTRSQRSSSSKSISSGVAGAADPPARRQQVHVQPLDRGIAAPRELRALERRHVLRIGDLTAELGERLELPAPAVARGLGDLVVDVVGEELERRLLAVLLAHEQHRDERREQRAEGRQRPRRRRHPVAVGAVADLVVVLREDDELLGRDVVGRRAEAPPAKARVLPVVHVRAMERLGQLRHMAELGVVAVVLVGHQRAQRMVEVVGPGGVAGVAAALTGAHHAWVVEPALGDHERARVDLVHTAGHRGDDVLGARVEDGPDRIQAQPIDAEVAHPALGALDHPLANRIAFGVVVVHGAAPRRLVLLGEVRTERLERRRARCAHVVVDHVEDHRQPCVVSGSDERGELVRTAVGGLGGGQIDAVVAPSVAAGELRDGHDLDRRDPELREPGKLARGGRERALRRERPDVQLVDDVLIERRRVHERSDRRRPPPRARGHATPRVASASTDRDTPRRRRARTGSPRPRSPPRPPRVRRIRRHRAQRRERRRAEPPPTPHAAPTRGTPSGRRRARARPADAPTGSEPPRPPQLPDACASGPHSSGTSQIPASGGSVISADTGCPCHGIGSGATPPRLPMSLPP